MKRLSFLFHLVFISIISFGQSTVPDAWLSQKVFDRSAMIYNGKFPGTLFLPKGSASPTLNGAKDSTGAIWVKSTNAKMYIYLRGYGWKQYATLAESDSISTLRSATKTLWEITHKGDSTDRVIEAPGILLSGLTASQLVATDGSKNLQSLTTATYPSLTELSYVKGATSSIQTQINTKVRYSDTAAMLLEYTRFPEVDSMINRGGSVSNNSSSGACLGNSTIAAYLGQSGVDSFLLSRADSLAGTTITNLAVPGNTIAQQQAAWLADGNKATYDWVVVEVGLNDLSPAESAATALGRYQTLIDTINSTKKTGAKVIVSTMTPCRRRLRIIHGTVNGDIAYTKWLNMNIAIMGGGPNVITGVDYRTDLHNNILNDGAGNLGTVYDMGDGIHESNAGRAVIAESWRMALNRCGFLYKSFPQFLNSQLATVDSVAVLKSSFLGVGTGNVTSKISYGLVSTKNNKNSRFAIAENGTTGDYFYGLGLTGGSGTGLGIWGGTDASVPYNGSTGTQAPLYISGTNIGIGTYAPTNWPMTIECSGGAYKGLFGCQVLKGLVGGQILESDGGGFAGMYHYNDAFFLGIHSGSGSYSASTDHRIYFSGSERVIYINGKPLLTKWPLSTITAGEQEFDSSHYLTNESLNRIALGGKIKGFTGQVNNSGTSETDLYTYTTKANTLASTDEELVFHAKGTFNDATATSTLKVYFGGLFNGNTGALAIAGPWKSELRIVRVNTTDVEWVWTVNLPDGTIHIEEGSTTGFTFTNTHIIKITGQAGGGTGGSNDITAKSGQVYWWGAANN